MGLRIGCGAGCSFDRIEPAADLIKYGELDYIVFECLAERTVADNLLKFQQDNNQGFTPMLEERMEVMLADALKTGTKIITNMGASNIDGAVRTIEKVARQQDLNGFKVGAVYGDDVAQYLVESGQLSDKQEDCLISANVYTGIEGIIQLLKEDCDIIVTGRIADASLFVAPIIHHYGWENNDDRFAQATLLGHFLECAGQITGGYAAEPGHKDIPDLWNLGFPIAEIEDKGDFIISKLDDTGGEISARICKEQLAYEINELEKYYTPNAIVDFSEIDIKEIAKDQVEIKGAKVIGVPDTLKVNICYHGKYLGIGEISYSGSNAYNKAKLCQEIVEGRLDLIGLECEQVQFDLVGHSSLNKKMKDINEGVYEARLRMAVKDSSLEKCKKAVREIDFMYTNGPAGSSGIDVKTKKLIEIESVYMPVEDLNLSVKVSEF